MPEDNNDNNDDDNDELPSILPDPKQEKTLRPVKVFSDGLEVVVSRFKVDRSSHVPSVTVELAFKNKSDRVVSWDVKVVAQAAAKVRAVHLDKVPSVKSLARGEAATATYRFVGRAVRGVSIRHNAERQRLRLER